MKHRHWPLITLILIFVIVSINCTSVNDSNGYVFNNYTYNHTASQNVTIDLRATVLGNTPIQILESPSDKIDLLVQYRVPPRVTFLEEDNNLNVKLDVVYPTDTWDIGCNIFVYLPDNANYNIHIRNDAYDLNSKWKEGSQTIVGNFKGPIKIVINNQTIVDKS